jgi:glycosyltransferase involved in cell wall biosynthesis
MNKLDQISLILPSRNNLKYLQWAYNSIRKNIKYNVEIIMLDDASTDGTWKWMNEKQQLDSNLKISRNNGPERIGHTVLYDRGIDLSTKPIVGIFHADMYMGSNALENALNILEENMVVTLTRVEPPLHPPDPSKHIADFGMEPEQFQEDAFLNFIKKNELTNKKTQGFFAPWIIHKKDFLSIGGHDKRVFAPMELEDSDIGNRFLLKGYNLIQIHSSFVYHMTCRGSRFKDGIKIIQEIPVSSNNIWKRAQDSDEYTKLRQNKFREWWRKWHSDVLHDANMLPIVNPRYDTGFVVKNCPYKLIEFIEPWCDTLFLESPDNIKRYIEQEQPHTKFDLSKRILPSTSNYSNDIIVRFDATHFNQSQMNIIKQFPPLIKDSGEIGIMEYDIFTFDIRNINQIEKKLIHADSPWYVNQIIE